MYEYLFYFLIYSFIGWCMEVAFVTVQEGKFVNRGFLNGPVCPVYGFGASAVVLLLSPIGENTFLLILGSIVVTTLVEYVTGWLLERIFHERWWDYSDQPFNIGGYVCLKASLGWGILCFLLYNHIHPLIARIPTFFSPVAGRIILIILYAVLLADIAATVTTLTKFKKREKEAARIGDQIRAVSDALGQPLAAGSLALSGRVKQSQDHLTEASKKFLVFDEAGELDIPQTKAHLETLYDEKMSLYKDRFFGQSRLLKAFPRLAERLSLSDEEPNDLTSEPSGEKADSQDVDSTDGE